MAGSASQFAGMLNRPDVPFLPLAVVGMECRLPGAPGLAAYERLLFEGRSGFGVMPEDRFDRSLYFDSKKGQPGKTYTELGGQVSEEPVNSLLRDLSQENLSLFDPVHLNFTSVVLRAWKNAGLECGDPRWRRTGIFVGHSGATQNGGHLNLATSIDEGLDFLNDVPAFRRLPAEIRKRCLTEVASAIRARRPSRSKQHLPRLNAYTAASLPATLLGLEGPRIVCDAACASSLFSLHQAAMAIQQGRLDAAIVGGATTNGVDNLILFSQSQACSDRGSSPFDQGASGLISSEGYAAIVLVPLSTARQLGMPVLGVLTGLGTASDGRGKSLWAPRAEGQQLAIRRAYPVDQTLNIDYLEAHATSTQLGDATELHAVHSILSGQRDRQAPLLIGSAKSNLGHTLETAGMAGLIKILLSMKRGEIPQSLNFESPNQNFDWSVGTVEVVARRRPWTPRHQARRSAVSAFGIGGLNAHLAVEEPTSITVRSLIAPAPPAQERIAIVGRGVVLPGGHHIAQFRELLQSGRSMIGPAPADRWRPGIGLSPSDRHSQYTSPTNHGGFIRDYTFNAESYRIPPKQVRQSNPIQMMLLDAVTQAIQERDGGNWKIDRQRAGVIIGTVFGGEFGTQLQLGLRLPEIARELTSQLQAKGIPTEQIEEMLREYRKQVLAARPALLDETGSFTASTLASRVAKTFDLMGGAFAIDVDNASGLAGLQLALDQLRCGHWDLAICGAADRSLDLMQFEQLNLQGKLVRSGRAAEIPDDCSQILPGEGVVVLMLQRLSDAVANQLPILGIIDDVTLSPPIDSVSGADTTPDATLVRQIGYLTGAQSLVRIVKESLNWQQQAANNQAVRSGEKQSVQIQDRTEDQLAYTVRFSSPATIHSPDTANNGSADKSFGNSGSVTSAIGTKSGNRSDAAAAPLAKQISASDSSSLHSERTSTAGTTSLSPNSNIRAHKTGKVPPVISRADMNRNGFHPANEAAAVNARVFRFSDRTSQGLLAQLESAISTPAAFQQESSAFAVDHHYRAAFLAETPQQLSTRLSAIVRQIKGGRQAGVFESERAILWRVRSDATRVAWVFPGQGAQYQDLPSSLLHDPIVEQELQKFDLELQRQRLEPFLPKLKSGTVNVADIWWNQCWVLGLSLALTSALRQRLPQPDVVLGHSFGEYSALVAAGTLTIPQVIRMVKRRADAVAMTVQESGQLISVRGTPGQVDAVLRESKLPYQTTHFNAPQQTVVATSVELANQVRNHLSSADLASVLVSVPVAYHTSRLLDAEAILDVSFSQEEFLPSRCPLMSATTARYLVEPSDLKNSLVSQMTRPVLYVPAIERLQSHGTAAFIEVGPNSVLSRLNQDICGDRALCLSFDAPGKHHTERLQLIQLVQEIIAFQPHSNPSTSNGSVPSWNESVRHDRMAETNGHLTTNGHVLSPAVVPEIEIVDLRRTGSKNRDAVSNDTPASNPVAPLQAALAPVTPAPVEELKQFLTTVVVDLTGYSPDVIDFDADLEADLGVDSIKKAQVVGEMAEQYGLNVAPSGVKLGDLKTLGDIARLGVEVLSSSMEATNAAPTDAALADVTTEIDEYGANLDSASDNDFSLESIERFLIDLVVDQTGYSPEVVDLDADMEADLGIDSIKQAQLLGEVQQQFELQNVIASQRTALPRFSTLRSILNFLSEHLPRNGNATYQVAVGNGNMNHGFVETLKKKADEFAGNGAPSKTSAVGTQWHVQHSNGHSPGFDGSWEVRGFSPVDSIPLDWKNLFLPTAISRNNAWDHGFARGEEHRKTIQASLRLLHDLNVLTNGNVTLEPQVEEELSGLAKGACVASQTVRAAYAHLADIAPLNRVDSKIEPTKIVDQTEHLPSENDVIPFKDLSGHVPPVGTGSMRFALRVVPAPQRDGMPNTPQFTGPGLVIGENPFAQAIIRQFAEHGLLCTQVPSTSSLAELDQALDKIWEQSPTPHLFITTSFDADSHRKLDARRWQKRRFAGLEVPYRVCQRWMQRTIDENRMDGGSVVLLTNLGGDFGFSGQSAVSSEGGLAGLVKAMLIECWMRGYRATPMKVIDLAPRTMPAEAVAGIWQELAVPSYDMEVAFHGRTRYTVQPIHRPLFPIGDLQPAPKNGHSQIRVGGTWVITGGARGITSVVARELAKRHHLKLHLIGTAPVPNLTDEIRRRVQQDRLQLRRDVMRDANLRNENGMEAWRNVEKSIEIDATLQLMKSEGIAAVYHSCDVSNLAQLERTLQNIRELDGRIDGVVHGAGIGQDARFDRKRPDKVDQCLRAKIDGCLNLMDATRQDRLDWFVSFGSISGRFGANGHTDYSLANDSLAKLTDRYRQERPDVRSVTFHWHAWGDIGMATKPETKLALEMINLEFMPAHEGITHFLHELEHGGEEPEVLITDRNYFRKFYPVDRLVSGEQVSDRERITHPMLDPDETGNPATVVSLSPKQERFLDQHLVQGRPTLPFVVALELMCEGARRLARGQDIVEIRDLRALQAIKWGNDAPLDLRVTADPQADGSFRCHLTTDVIRRDGRLVAKDKVFFQGAFQLGNERLQRTTQRPDVSQLNWEPINYLPPDAAIYHGPELQCLQKIAFTGDEAIGLISATSNVQLGTGHRPTYGWSVPCAVLDACLYAAAVFASRTHQRPSLPVQFDQIQLGRQPDPGEPCLVRIRQESEIVNGVQLSFQLIGLNGDVLFDVQGYQIGWLS